MKITSYYKCVKEAYEKYIVFVKFGKFYRCFDYDAYIIHYLFSYKVTSKDSIGFPIENIVKIKDILTKYKISYIIIDTTDDYTVYEFSNNEYEHILRESLILYNKEENKKLLFSIIEETLDKDYSNIYKIRDFIDNL